MMCPSTDPLTMLSLRVHEDIAVWYNAAGPTAIDVWCLHAFGDSHLAFREAFAQPLARTCRVLTLDLPGHGASPPRLAGLTIEAAARLCAELIVELSGNRAVVLVGHSMAAIIATRVARELARVRLVVSVEGNLTAADAYFSAQAAAFGDARDFYAAFRQQIDRMAADDEAVHQFACSLAFADPVTLWTLGRSVAACPAPGLEYANLSCASVYYWDPTGPAASARAFIAAHALRDRPLNGLGHWPMVSAPASFYTALEQDILGIIGPDR